MTSIGSAKPNDCVIVALANASGKDYQTIESELITINARLNPTRELHNIKRGIYSNVSDNWLVTNGWIKVAVPRRGQNKLSGIVRLSYGRKMQHLVYMKNGILFDSFNQSGTPIDIYKSKCRTCHVTAVWQPAMPVETRNNAPFTNFSILT